MRTTILLLLGLGLVACGGGSSTDAAKAGTATDALAEHTCTHSCVGGSHLYARGEKGHVCDPRCAYVKAKRM